MQGRKDFIPKLFYELSLEGLVPQEGFFRKVGEQMDVLMAALTYNLKKYLKFSRKLPQYLAQKVSIPKGMLFSSKIELHTAIFRLSLSAEIF